MKHYSLAIFFQFFKENVCSCQETQAEQCCQSSVAEVCCDTGIFPGALSPVLYRTRTQSLPLSQVYAWVLGSSIEPSASS